MTYLVTFYVVTTLNVIVSFDVKNLTLTKPVIEFPFFKMLFFVFVPKKWARKR